MDPTSLLPNFGTSHFLFGWIHVKTIQILHSNVYKIKISSVMVGFSIEIFIRNAESLDVVICYWLIKIAKMK